MTNQNNEINSMTNCDTVDEYKSIKICYRCLRKFDNNTNLKDGDKCPHKGCPGHILFLEEELELIFITLREKNYLPTWLCTGEFCSHGFVVSLYPFQCFRHLSLFPKDITSFNVEGAFLMERKYKNTDPVKRRLEVEAAINDFQKWVDKLPILLTLKTTLNFTSKAVAEKLNKQLLKSDDYYEPKVIDFGPGKYSVEFLRPVKDGEEEDEVAGIFPLYKNNKANLISFELKF